MHGLVLAGQGDLDRRTRPARAGAGRRPAATPPRSDPEQPGLRRAQARPDRARRWGGSRWRGSWIPASIGPGSTPPGPMPIAASSSGRETLLEAAARSGAGVGRRLEAAGGRCTNELGNGTPRAPPTSAREPSRPAIRMPPGRWSASVAERQPDRRRQTLLHRVDEAGAGGVGLDLLALGAGLGRPADELGAARRRHLGEVGVGGLLVLRVGRVVQLGPEDPLLDERVEGVVGRA